MANYLVAVTGVGGIITGIGLISINNILVLMLGFALCIASMGIVQKSIEDVK